MVMTRARLEDLIDTPPFSTAHMAIREAILYFFNVSGIALENDEDLLRYQIRLMNSAITTPPVKTVIYCMLLARTIPGDAASNMVKILSSFQGPKGKEGPSCFKCDKITPEVIRQLVPLYTEQPTPPNTLSGTPADLAIRLQTRLNAAFAPYDGVAPENPIISEVQSVAYGLVTAKTALEQALFCHMIESRILGSSLTDPNTSLLRTVYTNTAPGEHDSLVASAFKQVTELKARITSIVLPERTTALATTSPHAATATSKAPEHLLTSTQITRPRPESHSF
jgi:hypothetical protein